MSNKTVIFFFFFAIGYTFAQEDKTPGKDINDLALKTIQEKVPELKKYNKYQTIEHREYKNGRLGQVLHHLVYLFKETSSSKIQECVVDISKDTAGRVQADKNSVRCEHLDDSVYIDSHEHKGSGKSHELDCTIECDDYSYLDYGDDYSIFY